MPLRWPLRLYKEAMQRAIERGESQPDVVARAELFGDLQPAELFRSAAPMLGLRTGEGTEQDWTTVRRQLA